MKVVIAGAGLVGPLLALFLRRRGYEVHLHERRSDAQTVESRRSINLVITSRGIHALNELGLWSEAKNLTVSVRGRMIHSLKGDLAFQPYGRGDNECNYSISRSELNSFLLKKAAEAGVKIEFDSRLTSVDLKSRVCTFETVVSHASTRATQYDLFFAADGAGSVARHALERAGATQVQTDWLDTDYKELAIPKDLGAKMDLHALHIWPRGTHMMMALPNTAGDFTVTLYLPRAHHEWSFENLRTEADIKKLFQSQFSDALDLIPNYLEDFMKNPQGRLGTVRASTWIYEDSFCLIGDAAHAIVPFFGQGMNLGFEDCTTLATILDRAPKNNQQNNLKNKNLWAHALNEFDSIQRPNANAIADMALDNFIEMRDRVGQAQFQLKKKIEARIEHEFPELYRSRYAMVTYTLIPYKLAQEAGRIQSEILEELALTATSSDDVDLKVARNLIEQKLTPFYQKHGLTTARFAP